MRSILVLCTGNICRNPMAEVLWPASFEVSSAGLGALVGHPADPHAVALTRHFTHAVTYIKDRK